MLAALVSLSLLAAAPPVDSLGQGWRPQQDEVRAGRRAGQVIPLDQAIRAVQARIPGRLLDAGLESGDNGRRIYRMRWAAADGRRLDVLLDAATGQVLGQEGR